MEQTNLATDWYSITQKRVSSVLGWFKDAGAFFVVAMMLITVWHAAGRYAFNAPVPGLVEVSGFLLTTMMFLSLPNTTLQRGHISIGLFVERMSPRKQAFMEIFNYVFCLLFAVCASWQSLVHGAYLMHARQLSDILRIPKFPFFYVECFGWALMSLAILILLVNFYRKAVEK